VTEVAHRHRRYDAFNERNLKSRYAKNPLEDDSLAKYQVLNSTFTKLTAEAVSRTGSRPAKHLSATCGRWAAALDVRPRAHGHD